MIMEELNSNNKVFGTITKVQGEKETTKQITESDFVELFNGLRTKILGKSIDDAKKDYEGVLSLYKEESKSIAKDLVRLYQDRKKSVELIQKAYDFLNQCNSNAITINSVRIALSYTSVFRKIMELDLKGDLPRIGEEAENIEHYSASVLTGLRTQDAVSSLAASLGSALAITTALSSTIAYGSTAIALIAGPIGWITGGIVLTSVGFRQWKKNKEIVKKLEDGTNEIRTKLKIVKSEHNNLKLLINKTDEMNRDFQDCFDCLDGNCSEKEAVRIADICKSLGKIMNETIEMQH
jgi:hypothetical protein